MKSLNMSFVLRSLDWQNYFLIFILFYIDLKILIYIFDIHTDLAFMLSNYAPITIQSSTLIFKARYLISHY